MISYFFVTIQIRKTLKKAKVLAGFCEYLHLHHGGMSNNRHKPACRIDYVLAWYLHFKFKQKESIVQSEVKLIYVEVRKSIKS